MVLKVSIFLNLVFVVVGIFTYFQYRSEKVFELEKGRENYEAGRYCASLENFFKGADFDISYYEIIGKFYLKGQCVSFDPKLAVHYYKRIFKSDAEVGRIIMLDILNTLVSSAETDRNQVIQILKEVKSLGYMPTLEQLDSLKEEEFKIIFKG